MLKDNFQKLLTKTNNKFIIWKCSEFYKEAKSTRKFDIVNAKVNDNLNVMFYFFYDFNGHTAYLIYIVLETKWKIWW